jgi:hypothetical protein
MPAGMARPGRRWLAAMAFALATMLCAYSAAFGEVRPPPTGEVDTEHMFGFTEGSDIGEKGETELMSETTGHFGKLGGFYGQAGSMLEAKHTLAENFRVSAAATASYFDMTGVTGLEDRRSRAFQALSFSARYRVLDREHSPVGLTFSIEPRRGFVDDVAGVPADQIGAEFLALLDRELLPGRLFGAFNVSYEPERTRLRGNGETVRDSILGLDAALTLRVASAVYVGAEANYLRRYDGLALNEMLGQALYVGPTVYATLGSAAFFSATWSAQVWGADGNPHALDLVNFDRQRVKVRMGYNF